MLPSVLPRVPQICIPSYMLGIGPGMATNYIAGAYLTESNRSAPRANETGKGPPFPPPLDDIHSGSAPSVNG